MIKSRTIITQLFQSRIIKHQVGPEYNRSFKKEEGYIWEGYLNLNLFNGYTLNFKLYHNYTKDLGKNWSPDLDSIYSEMILQYIILPNSNKFLNAWDHVLFVNNRLYFFNKSFSEFYNMKSKYIKTLIKDNYFRHGPDYEIII